MTESACPFATRRDDVLVAFLYDELEAAERERFESHLVDCRECRDEVAALREVRGHLAAWTPPVFSLQSAVGSRESVVSPEAPVGSPESTVVRGPAHWWHQVPVWAEVAAAVLVLGVSAGIANLNVHYDQSGLTIRTGWSRATETVAAAPTPAPAAASTDVPWRADLTALERQLRTEFHGTAAAPAPAPARAAATDAEILKRVRALLDESETKQRRDLDLRVAEVLRDVENERRTDLVRINQSLGQIQSNTGVEVMKQRQLLNYLVRVSSQK